VDNIVLPSQLPSLGMSGWDIAFVDIHFEGAHETGLDALEWLSIQSPETHLVLFTTPGHGRDMSIIDAFVRYRIRGAVSKTQKGAIQACLRDVLAGRSYVDDALRPYSPPERDERFAIRIMLEDPSNRDVLFALIDEIRTWHKIGDLLGISDTDVMNRVRSMKKHLVAAGYTDPDQTMTIGDWTAFVTQYRDHIENEAARIELLQRQEEKLRPKRLRKRAPSKSDRSMS
jgi:hypothetical protein